MANWDTQRLKREIADQNWKEVTTIATLYDFDFLALSNEERGIVNAVRAAFKEGKRSAFNRMSGLITVASKEE